MRTPSRPPIHRASRPSAGATDSDELDRLAAEVLTFLAAEPSRLERFFAVTGLSVASLRRAAGTPSFAAHLLDHLAADPRDLLAFAAETGRDLEAIESTRRSLAPDPGAD